MRRLPTGIIGTSILTVAGSVLAVGVVWASGSALQNDTGSVVSTVDTAVPPDTIAEGDQSTDSGEQSSDVTFQELVALVGELSVRMDLLAESVSDSSRRVSALESRVAEVSAEVGGVKTRVAAVGSEIESIDKKLSARVQKVEKSLDDVAEDVERARSDAADALERIGTLGTTVGVLEKKASQLSDEGTYTGTVTPSQLSRRLTANDLSGDWPLDRTAGMLKTSSIEASSSGCWSDSRYHVVMAVDPFRRLECLRIAK